VLEEDGEMEEQELSPPQDVEMGNGPRQDKREAGRALEGRAPGGRVTGRRRGRRR
jgi:hypothetical protein